MHFICPTGRWDADSEPPVFRPWHATACELPAVRADQVTNDERRVTCDRCRAWLDAAQARLDAHLAAEPGRRARLLAELDALEEHR